ncbi:MAG: UDP-N-acetyl-D-glucosamine dehydrogenase [Candidatus Omnitrophica bacterium CG11_big_fil_rev_8_21_14_0_20_64_10]|nr:MAG: UDP-N-acetyl-D-glucosamine dehydrogenase [Candidatus Omnitrophica bacterium CG11_big_fil_rev_8_21_14_0_20_64_10]
MKRTLVAVIGVGHLGAIHSRVYSQLKQARLVAVCDTDRSRAEAAARQFGCRAETDYRKILSEVEAASIAVPTPLHFPIARDCIKAGLHLLIEKPITRTLQEADQLLRLARSKKRVLQVGHIERFNAAIGKVAQVLKNPRFIEVHRLAPFQPRGTEVGVVLDLMIHDLDLILWLVGSPVRKIDAVGVPVLTPFEDIANARVTFANGAVANLTASRISIRGMRKFRFFQGSRPGKEEGAYVSIDFLTQEMHLYRKQRGKITHEPLSISGEEPLRAELASFLKAVQTGGRPTVTGEEARAALAAALQVTRQIQRGLAPWGAEGARPL